jgi:uridine kinase
MARWAPGKRDQLQALADEILHNYGHGRSIVAVDGASASGAGPFADGLAEELRRKGVSAFRASIDDFHRPRSERERDGWLSPRAFYESSYDYSLLRRILIDPFHTAGSAGFVLAGFDERRDEVIHQPKWITAGPDAVLVIEGRFLNRPELAGLWNYSIWVTASAGGPHETDAADEERRRDLGADELYAADASPAERASAIIDNTDAEHPKRVFADAC